MSKHGYGAVTDLVCTALADIGPCTSKDVGEWTGVDDAIVRRTLRRLEKIERVHIKRWLNTVEGERNYPRPVWCLGADASQKKPPVVTDAERKREFRRLCLAQFRSIDPTIKYAEAEARSRAVRKLNADRQS